MSETRRIPISEEFDNLIKEYYVEADNDQPQRNLWDSILKFSDPEIGEFEERIDPIKRTAHLCRIYLPKNRFISQEILVTLISQHLRILGLTKTQVMLQQESLFDIKFPAHLLCSHLNFLIQRGIMHAERLWDCYDPNDTTKFDEEAMRLFNIIPNQVNDDSPIENEEIIGDTNQIATDDNNNLTQATLNQLILILTSETNIGTKNLLSAFCLSYRSVVTCDKLFIKIRDRFRMCIKNGNTEGLNLTCNLFTEWLRRGINEIEPATIEAAKYFAEKELKMYFDITSFFPEKRSEFKYTVSTDNAPKVNIDGLGISLWTGNFSLTDLHPKELARQITYKCSKSFYAIQASELINADSESRAPNVNALINFGKNLTLWAAGVILTRKTVDKRISTMKYFIEVARQLWDMCNFFCAYAVCGAFSNNALFRLNAHMSLVPKTDTQFIKSLDNHIAEANYRYLRDMQAAEIKTRPVIPLFSIVMQDLKRQEEYQKTMIGDKINLLKFTCTYKIINDCFSFQDKKYCFLPIMQVQEKLEHLNVPDNDWLMTVSMEIEPQNSTIETIRTLDHKRNLSA